MKNLSRVIFAVFVWIFLPFSSSLAQTFSYSDESLITIIQDIESQTPFRFLYREALISDIKITLTASESDILEDLSEILLRNNIGLKIDEDRHQALLFKTSPQQDSQTITINGNVIDARSGERLPFATISWRQNGDFRGVATTASGAFSITTASSEQELSFLISYLGYHPKQLELSFDEVTNWNDLAIRLEPETYGGKEIIVSGVNFYTAQDTVLKGLIKMGTFSPLGESNAFKSLQMLPSVTMNSAMNDGINIRGSSSDGFQVLLDGQIIYNQSHLFGMLDAMNPDALKTSGFYYDITPAQYQAPLGGTLSMVTRSGSLNELRSSFGLSNTAFKSTFEGPIVKGKSSWLVSGRVSYLDELNWFNNSNMIEYGLDVNRPADVVSTEVVQLAEQLGDIAIEETEVRETDAQFYDLHSKLYFETVGGSQVTLSGYLGHDNAYQNYFREQVDPNELFETTNEWDSHTLTGSFNTLIGNTLLSNSRMGYTYYASDYSKDDFEYPIRQTQNEGTADSVLVEPLNLNNSITQFDVEQSFVTNSEKNTSEFGFSYSDYQVEYEEASLDRQSYQTRTTSQLIDAFHQMNISSVNDFVFNVGNRVHFFSNGSYLRWSPRLKANYQLNEKYSFALGYSRNYQFMHRLEFYNINSNDFWIMTTEDEPPSSVDYFSSGVYFNIHPMFYLQIEGYYKYYENIRLHELNTGLISVAFGDRDVPVLYDSYSKAKGVEMLVKNRFKRLSISTSYTLSSSRIQNDELNDGSYFYASWDRRHQLSLTSEAKLSRHLTLYLGWTFGTGTPDYSDLRLIENSTRLEDYSRVDASIDYQIDVGGGFLKASFSIYNLLNRDNPWYSERQLVSLDTNNRTRTGSALTTVYDLGFQPSFNIGFSF